MNNLELFEIIKKPWAGTKEIIKLSGCSTRHSAGQIRNAIYEETKDKGMKIPGTNKVVSMKSLIKYLGIDENRIIRFAKAEAEMASIQKKSSAPTDDNIR